MTTLGVVWADRQAAPTRLGLAVPDGWKIGAIWLVVTAYNLFKPYHIDDTAHLEIARWIAAYPLHPMSGTLNWSGSHAPIYLTNQPHLYFYLLAVWGSLFSFGEVAMHVLQALFALAAILLFHRIALHLVPAHAIWLTGMLALGPSFAVEQNLMVDVPLLALWLLFFHAMIVGADAGAEGQRRRFLVAALACAGALLVKYSSLVLLPILVAVIIYERRWQFGWTILVPLATLGGWSVFNLLDYGGIHIAELPPNPGQGVSASLRRVVAWMLTLGAITPFGLVTIVRLWPALRRRGPAIYTMTALLLALLVAGVATGQLDEGLVGIVLRVAFLLNACAMATAVAVAARRWVAERRGLSPPSATDSRLLILLLWIVGHLAFYSLFAPFTAVRHLLLVLPAVLLVGALLWPRRLPRADAVFALAVSLTLFGALGWADWRVAAFYRDEAATIRATLPSGARAWFTGHWGWQWYAQQSGLSAVDVQRPELVRADFLVVPRDVPGEAIQNLPPLVLVRTDSKPLGVGDLFCTSGLAGFYITRFVERPWRLTRSCTNTVDIYRVA